MKTTLVGFPRIGKNRELKTLLDSYFKNRIDGTRLIQEAAALEEVQLQALSQQLDVIPCADFSLYDGMLDMLYLFGCIPPRFKDIPQYAGSLAHRDLETRLGLYFAMARGSEVQGKAIYPLEMKKWFTTNYHYLVPELSLELSWELETSFLEAHIERARRLHCPFKVHLIGPLTFLYLSKILEGPPDKYLDTLVIQYQRLFRFLQQKGVEWVQLEEPILVTDLCHEDVKRFQYLYKTILFTKGTLKVLLQTYFGDIRDVWSEVCQQPFDAVGLDFVAGTKNKELIQTEGFPKNTILVAGCIDGRNIWRANLEELIPFIQDLQSKMKNEIWLSSSCSLLHVPYTVEGERKLPPELKRRLAFAWEKVGELEHLKTAVREARGHLSVSEKAHSSSSLPPSTFVDFSLTPRPIPRHERYWLQQKRLSLPILPTTTIGSFPQDEDLRRLRKQYRQGKIDENTYEDRIRQRIRALVVLQEELGLDVLVHGEYERNDMVEYFAEYLEGFYTTEEGWVQSYGSRVTKPPIIYGDIHRTHPITVPWISYAQSLTQKPMKAILTGPITIINWSFVREDLALSTVAFQLAEALRAEISELQEKGIPIIQVDEAALREKLPLRRGEWEGYINLAVAAFRRATESVRPDVQLHTHMCYSEFGSLVYAIEAFDVDVITIEAARSHFGLLSSFREYGKDHPIGPGVYDIHSPLVPSVAELEKRIRRMLEYIPPDMLWINPDCGLKTRGMEETVAALNNMVQATQRVRQTLC
ncbi:5-methyltetrahydropteroyltriglutamate--homocysteine S-methyltransferase [Gracilinema caldarium]|uniref:5-methyltetrahydropteroyltriglutamate--homocysteine S-methyltransferase n=1 Tax=Gracilinema caldarium (strain ATCC 51460 / DSM 7334 / H1) TaxID=744872 RepID=F8EXD5_GRAC1|nr:5-methyltetrahydropteroyltriglutamate--homocysteine S-methyltransferase [Gracilinema caldarium]AEJ19162.1 5-methyltetrahydropteroyltriglutamate--homocysteine S-methyltransferase [Gracilinema caldarium DSM 7334]